MLKFIQVFVALFAFVFYANAFAIDEAYVKTQTQSFMQDLDAKITLSAEQKTEMEKILSDSISQRETIIAKYKGQKGIGVKKKIRDELEAVNASTQAQVQKVLTEQQYKDFLTVQEAHKQQVRDRINSEF